MILTDFDLKSSSVGLMKLDLCDIIAFAKTSKQYSSAEITVMQNVLILSLHVIK